MPRRYAYVGPESVRKAAASEPAGVPITTASELLAWLTAHPEASTEGATFVVDPAGVLRLAPRRSEHVACAQGGAVLAAGEMAFARRGQVVAVADVSNQSTGFCPEPTSFEAVARALDALGVARPPSYTTACTFRRCPACGQINLVKDEWFECGCCAAPLPHEWNFAP